MPLPSDRVVLAGLVPMNSIQYTLFDNIPKIKKMARIYDAVDKVSKKFGKHTIQHAASLPVKRQAQHEGERGDVSWRKKGLLEGEGARKRLGLPLLDIRI